MKGAYPWLLVDFGPWLPEFPVSSSLRNFQRLRFPERVMTSCTNFHSTHSPSANVTVKIVSACAYIGFKSKAALCPLTDPKATGGTCFGRTVEEKWPRHQPVSLSFISVIWEYNIDSIRLNKGTFWYYFQFLSRQKTKHLNIRNATKNKRDGLSGRPEG